MEKTQLLCTFATLDNLSTTLQLIIETYGSVSQIFVLQNTDDENEVYCTYNVEARELKEKHFLKNTISVHRNKSTNTLYTINAINQVVFLLNNGVKDTSFTIDWTKFRNSILVTNENGLRRINTRIYKIQH